MNRGLFIALQTLSTFGWVCFRPPNKKLAYASESWVHGTDERRDNVLTLSYDPQKDSCTWQLGETLGVIAAQLDPLELTLFETALESV